MVSENVLAFFPVSVRTGVGVPFLTTPGVFMVQAPMMTWGEPLVGPAPVGTTTADAIIAPCHRIVTHTKKRKREMGRGCSCQERAGGCSPWVEEIFLGFLVFRF